MKFQAGLSVSILGASLALSSVSLADNHEHAGHDHAAHGAEHAGHDDAAHSHEAHGSEHEEAGAHGEAGSHGAHGHVPQFSDINWFHGLIGEKEGVEPSLLWRPPGMPVPLGALFLNTAILFFLIGRLGGPGIKNGLKSRKARIAGDIQKAAKMKEEAEEQLAHYEGKLSEMEAEMTRIKKEMREQAEADQARILTEAKSRREALEAEAKLMVEHELAQARRDATTQAVSSAVRAAREQIEKSLSSQDQERLATELLSGLGENLKKGTEATS